MTTTKRNMWQYPWRYKESIAFIAGIIVVGCILQFVGGNFDYTLLQFPANLIIGITIIVLSALICIGRENPVLKWFTGIPFSVTLIGTIMVLALIMGLTPQLTRNSPTSGGLVSTLGFNKMTSSWPMVLTYFLLLLSLGGLIIRRLIAFRWKDYAFYLNHIGLWLLLFFAGLGTADMRRYVMYVREGEVEWRVFSADNDVLELPIAIQLNDFYMEEYPPKLAVINRHTGASQPEDTPRFMQIDESRPEYKIDRWELKLDEYIHEAVRNSDSTYHEVLMPGASPAAKVTVKNTRNGEIKQGWVSVGNMSQLYMVLNLDDDFCVAMTQPEPKRFVSDIEVLTPDGKKTHTLLEVNKPFKAGNWMLYQYSYDSEAGKLSTYSAIELVYDPWIIPVYIGIIMLMLGSVCMLWSGNKKRKEQL